MENLDAILTSAEEMERSGKVNLSIIPLIQQAIGEANRKEVESRKLPTSREDAFVKFHAWRNIGAILGNIKARFEEGLPDDNPQVAEDTLRAVPEIQILEGILLSVDQSPTTSHSRQLVLDRVSQLRETARL